VILVVLVVMVGANRPSVAGRAIACHTAGAVRHALAVLLGVVQRSIRSHALLAPGDRVLVAVSGGPDSTGLLLALAQLRKKLGIDLVAAHVNHRLRGADAERDEACAAQSAAALRVPFVRTELPAELGRGANLEARARRLRYAALRRLAHEQGCTRIATGHTLDDQAETVVMRLLRGSSGRGLGAIQPRRADRVIRPLIDCRRADVEAVVRQAGLAYRLDRSNRDPRFLRTHVRERVLPLLAELNPSIARACANLAAAARAERRIVTEWADGQLEVGAGEGRLDITWLHAIPPPLRTLLVRRWLLRAGVAARDLTARHVEAVRGLAESARGGTETHLPGGWTVRRAGQQLRAERVDARGRSSGG
jgi:tRNA(Ile)-lysidine synthase